uniref:Uncharacterized protein n=1 Tax=Oryzias latipes TaxID=8090 RepID=A0A3P9JQ56_ORYLA
MICIVPDICGSPPSTAVSTKGMNSFFSLSRAFCKTISTFFDPSAWLRNLREKLSLGLRT